MSIWEENIWRRPRHNFDSLTTSLAGHNPPTASYRTSSWKVGSRSLNAGSKSQHPGGIAPLLESLSRNIQFSLNRVFESKRQQVKKAAINFSISSVSSALSSAHLFYATEKRREIKKMVRVLFQHLSSLTSISFLHDHATLPTCFHSQRSPLAHERRHNFSESVLFRNAL